jgi:hypothetical protein
VRSLVLRKRSSFDKRTVGGEYPESGFSGTERPS